jgi:hypothetical protein
MVLVYGRRQLRGRVCFATSILAWRATLRRSRVCQRDPAGRKGYVPTKQAQSGKRWLRGDRSPPWTEDDYDTIYVSEITYSRD